MQFWLFRVSLNASEVNTLFAEGLNDTSRYDALRRAILNPKPATYRQTLYSLYNVEPIGDSLVGRISHPDEIDRTVSADQPNTLRDIREDSNAWAHFIFTGFGEQIFAVQRKQDFFSGEADGLATIIRAILETSINDDRIQVVVSPLKREGDFWATLAHAERLYKVEFEFVAPNMFGGRKPLTEILQVQRLMHNATLFKAGIENPNGQLEFPQTPETIAEVNYAASGGGSWAIDALDKDGFKMGVKSDRDAAIIIEVPDDNESKRTIRYRVGELIKRIKELL